MASHERSIRIAMLNAATPVPHVKPKWGSLGAMFQNLLRDAASRIAPNVTINSHDFDVCRGEYPAVISDFDAILITGSGDSSYDDLEWIRKLDEYVSITYQNEPKVKIFGSCFGHQLVCQSLFRNYGVHVEKDPSGPEIGVHKITVNEAFRKAFEGSRSGAGAVIKPQTPEAQEDGPSVLVPKTLRLQFIHSDRVRIPSEDALPKPWKLLGTTRQCASQGVYEPGRVFTTQGHCEFDRFINSETVKFIAPDMAWGDEEVQKYLDAIDKDDDAAIFGELMLRFFLENGTAPSLNIS